MDFKRLKLALSYCYKNVPSDSQSKIFLLFGVNFFVVVVVLLFYVHGKHLRSCKDGQLTQPYFSWAGLDLLSG